MGEEKKYKEQCSGAAMMVDEPVMAYGIDSAITDLNVVSPKTMKCLIDSAMDDFRLNRCTSHSEMDEWVNMRMGWK